MISRENYEIWFLNFLDGKLSPDEREDFRRFLDQNQDLAEELEGMDMDQVAFNPEVKHYPDKVSLLKNELPLDEEEINLLLAKKLEGELSEEENSHINSLIQEYSWVVQSWERMKHTRLPQIRISYDKKDSLLIPDEVDMAVIDYRAIALTEGDWEEAVKNEELESLAVAYSKIKLAADLEITFEGKKSLLKQGKVVSIWAQWSKVAAVAALVLVTWMATYQLTRSTGAPIAEVKDARLSRSIAKVEKSTSPTEQETFGVTEPFELQEEQPSKEGEFADTRRYAGAPSLLIPIEDYRIFEGCVALEKKVPSANEIILPESVPDKGNDFISLRTYLAENLKKQIWGEEDFPQENFALALVQKAGEKISNRTRGELEFQVKEKRKGFHFKLGPLEVTR